MATLDASAKAEVARMRLVSPEADPATLIPDVHPAHIPRHVAFIMDGNGRWAKQQGLPRVFGHRHGAIAVREVVRAAGRIGIECVTLYSFSSENWRRPSEEVAALMELCIAYCQGEKSRMIEENIRVQVIGRREPLPANVLAALDDLVEATSVCTGPTLCLAINYGSRAEIVDATRRLAARVAQGEIEPGDIDEALFSASLDTNGLPDPDLLVRTAGELRLSNYLLWQLSYAELYVSDVLWPDFGEAELHEAVRAYARRSRRFGGLADPADA